MGGYRVEWTECGEWYRKRLPKKFRRISKDISELEKYLRQSPVVTDADVKYKDSKITVYKRRFGIATERLSARRGLRVYFAEHSDFTDIRLIACIYYKGDIQNMSQGPHLKLDQETEVFKSVIDYFTQLANKGRVRS